MMIRGRSTENPVLLFLAGGPGGTEMGAMRRHLEALERHFVVVTWDQRGTGKSYGELDPTSTLTPQQAVSDTLEVTKYLRDRFGEDRIYLLGQSWGSLLGVLAVQRRPELYRAYRDTLDWARQNGKDDVAGTLTDIGPPRHESILEYEPALSYEHEVYPYDRRGNSEGEGGFSENLFVEEYTLLEQVHNLGAFLDTFSVLYPQIKHIDLRESAAELEVPVYLIQGRHEARAGPARRLVVSQALGAEQADARPRYLRASAAVRAAPAVCSRHGRHRAWRNAMMHNPAVSGTAFGIGGRTMPLPSACTTAIKGRHSSSLGP